MIKYFIMALVAILSIAAICIAISARNILAGLFISALGIISILVIVGLFMIPYIAESPSRKKQSNVIDAEM